jgi:uncharacterized C2H2 Zn-finger protein
MARARRAAAAKTNNVSAGDSALSCPECGKTFARPASLGAHRNRAHGIAGGSKRAQRTRTRATAQGSATRRSSSNPPATRRQTTRATSNGNSSGRGQTSAVNRDALLQALFPNGVPAREAVIRRANAWLDEADQLARAR